MAWGKIDDKLHSHVKWRRASKGARALWTTALSWCCSHPSDGFVPGDMLRTLDGTKKEADDLVRVGLWIREDDGYRFHEWSERNPDATSIKARRDAESQAGTLGNHRRWHAKRGVKVAGCEHCASGTRSGNPTTTRIGGESSRTRTRTQQEEVPDVVSPRVERRDDEPPELEVSVPRHRMPASWAPSTTHKAKCLERGIDLPHELEQFRSHAKARAVVAVDWDAEFDRWLGNARPRTTNGNRPTAATGTTRALAALAIADQLDAQERSTRGAITDGPTTR